METLIKDNDITFEIFEAAIKRKIVAMDIETNGLSPDINEMATCQVYVKDFGVEILRFRNYTDCKHFKQLMEDENIKKIFHYAIFDVSFICKKLQIKPKNIVCTKIASRLVNNDIRHGLGSIVKHYLGVKIEKDQALSNWFSDVLTEDQIRYAVNDVVYLEDLYNILYEKIKEKNLTRFYNQCCKNIPFQVALKLFGHEKIYDHGDY